MINKKNSILFNQEWLSKIIEEGRLDLLPSKKPEDGLSIGEYLELEYQKAEEHPRIKVTAANSILYDREWASKFSEEKIKVVKYRSEQYSLGEYLARKYFRIQRRREYSKTLKK